MENKAERIWCSNCHRGSLLELVWDSSCCLMDTQDTVGVKMFKVIVDWPADSWRSAVNLQLGQFHREEPFPPTKGFIWSKGGLLPHCFPSPSTAVAVREVHALIRRGKTPTKARESQVGGPAPCEPLPPRSTHEGSRPTGTSHLGSPDAAGHLSPVIITALEWGKVFPLFLLPSLKFLKALDKIKQLISLKKTQNGPCLLNLYQVFWKSKPKWLC